MRGPSEKARNQTVNEAQNAENKQSVVAPDHDLEPDSGPTRAEDPLDQQWHHEEDVESDGLHRIETDVVGEGRVADDAQVEGEEGDEGGVGDGAVEPKNGEEGLEGDAEGRVLGEQEAPVLEGVEEGESVGDGGDEAVGRRSRVVGHANGGGSCGERRTVPGFDGGGFNGGSGGEIEEMERDGSGSHFLSQI